MDFTKAEFKILRIVEDRITPILSNGKPEGALCKIPFELNGSPDQEWSLFFLEYWNSPREYTTMHRPGIATVDKNWIKLKGTTVDEVKKYHKKTLLDAVNFANVRYNTVKEEEYIQNAENEKKIKDITESAKEEAADIEF